MKSKIKHYNFSHASKIISKIISQKYEKDRYRSNTNCQICSSIKGPCRKKEQRYVHCTQYTVQYSMYTCKMC